MTHNERRASWFKEAIFSSLTGLLYGGACGVAGHPLDTVKTQM